MSGSILQSLPLDSSKAVIGLPFCAPGKQPTFPEETKSQIQKLPSDGLELLIKKLNKIFKETGCPIFPLGLLWLVFIASLIFNFQEQFGNQWTFRVIGLSCGFVWCIASLVCQHKRRTSLSRTLQEWNRSDGVTYGVHVEIGGKDGEPLSSCKCGKSEIFLHVYEGPGDAELGCMFAV